MHWSNLIYFHPPSTPRIGISSLNKQIANCWPYSCALVDMSSFDGQTPVIGILTAGGLAPCLSACVGYLFQKYASEFPEGIKVICYKNGYKGLLIGDSVTVNHETLMKGANLLKHGGSPIGNSRVKLTNIKDCIKRKLVKPDEIPLEVAARQLQKDGVTVLHTIGGDDTNTQAAMLSKFLAENNYNLCVVGLPKTVDNDVFPVRQSLGAFTAAEQGALFFHNVVNETSASPRMLIIHECMGRDCGYLTAYTAKCYHDEYKIRSSTSMLDQIGFVKGRKDIHALYIPEVAIDIAKEAARLRRVMDTYDCVNIFISEGANVEQIVAEMEASGEDVPRDAFGHVKLDAVNPGAWFSKQFADKLGAEKVLVQKSGYFSRSAAANEIDLKLIDRCCTEAVKSGLAGVSGCVGEDEERGNELRAIEFPRVKGARPFDIKLPWFHSLMTEINNTYY